MARVFYHRVKLTNADVCTEFCLFGVFVRLVNPSTWSAKLDHVSDNEFYITRGNFFANLVQIPFFLDTSYLTVLSSDSDGFTGIISISPIDYQRSDFRIDAYFGKNAFFEYFKSAN